MTSVSLSRLRPVLLVLALALLAGCASSPQTYRTYSGTSTSASAPSARVLTANNPAGLIARSSQHQKVGRPYTVSGRTYVPQRNDSYDETGIASWYGPNFHGRPTANGEVFDQNLMTAAHPTLPIPSIVEVTNLENGRQVILRLNDRGPFVDDRMIDLSRGAATQLGFIGRGLARVRVRYLGPAHPASSAPQSGYMMADASGGSTRSSSAMPAPAPAMPAPVMPASTPVLMADATPALPASSQSRTGHVADNAPLEALPPGSSASREITVETISDVPAQPESSFSSPAESQSALPDRLTLQIGAFSSPVNADQFARRVSGMAETRIVQGQSAGRPIWRVFVGTFDSHQSAAQFQSRLRDVGISDSRITPLG